VFGICKIWGSIDGVGIKETDGDVDGGEEVDGTKDGSVAGEVDG